MKAFGVRLPACAKFCDPKYNIKAGCNTIRLGTLYSYRSIENELLRDKGEGTFSYNLEFSRHIEVSPQWLASFEVEGGGTMIIGDMQIVNNRVRVKQLSLSGSTHNCWIYCISKSVHSAGSVTDAHADKWTIEGDNLPAFANYLGSVLWNELTFQDLPTDLTSKYSLQEIQQRLSLSVEIREVEYVDRYVMILEPEDFPALDIEALRDSVAFKKPKEFEGEQEVRFAFWLTFDGKKISIIDKPKTISLRPIDKFL